MWFLLSSEWQGHWQSKMPILFSIIEFASKLFRNVSRIFFFFSVVVLTHKWKIGSSARYGPGSLGLHRVDLFIVRLLMSYYLRYRGRVYCIIHQKMPQFNYFYVEVLPYFFVVVGRGHFYS